MDLISPQRATQNATLATLAAPVTSGGNPAYLASLISAASDAVRKYCSRDFVLTAFSEYYTIGAQPPGVPFLLRNFPVIEITRVACANQCLLVQNSGGANQRATVETTTTGVKLVTVSSGISTPTTLLYSTYVTIQAVATAINALGNGWGTSIWSGQTGSYALWPSADLKPLQGAVSALNAGAYLEIYDDYQSGTGAYGWEHSSGGPGWRLEPETGELYMRIRRGPLELRVDYTAGFTSVPQAVQEATVAVAQSLYQSSLANSAYSSVKLGNTSVEIAKKFFPDLAKALLSGYVDHARAISR
jgi:hypothetical protein